MEKKDRFESREQLSPERLFEAVEAALHAVEENAEYTGGAGAYPLDLMGSPVQPECLSPFTRFEIEQACEFLVRMGAIESPRRKAA